uniref:Dna binding protein ncp1 n=1 Tax=Moniliophthora roreri TaxID=221103 RepID=A0A0W0FMP9_MONRR
MPSVEPTPSSERSLYFDAPIAHFQMQDPGQPIAKPDGSEPVADLTREPTVAGGIAAPFLDGTNGKKTMVNGGDTAENVEDAAVTEEEEKYTAHPNGSEGWLPATDVPPEPETTNGNKPVRSSSVLKKKRPGSVSSRTSASGVSLHRNKSTSASVKSVSRRSLFTNVDGEPVDGSTFINGAGTTGPGASAFPDESLKERVATADGALTPKQKSKIAKQEVKDGKRLSKIIKQEGKVEKQALGVAINELAELQKIQKAAVKREAKCHTAHTKAVTAFQKVEAAYLAARTKYETAQALMVAEQETLDIARNAAIEATAKMQEKSQEVDSLRQTYGVDERERAVKISELTTSKSKTRWK